MIDQAEVRQLLRENKKLKSRILDQSRVFQEERAKLLTINRSLRAGLEEQHQRNQQAIEDFNIRITELEAELRRAQVEPPPPRFPATALPRKPIPRRSTITFQELEAENQRIFEETNRIFRQCHDPQTIVYHPPSPRADLTQNYRPQNIITIEKPSFTPEARRVSPIDESRPHPVVHHQKAPEIYADPPKQEEEEEEEEEEEAIEPRPSPKPNPIPAQKEPLRSQPRDEKPIPVETTSTTQPPKQTFQARPISGHNSNSINDDFFGASIEMPPTVEPPKTAVVPQTQTIAPQKQVKKAPPKPKIGSDSEDLSLGGIDISFPEATPPSKGKAAPKANAARGQTQANSVKEHESADGFGFNEDDIHFDFDGHDPFG
jgi:hypothetical protein